MQLQARKIHRRYSKEDSPWIPGFKGTYGLSFWSYFVVVVPELLFLQPFSLWSWFMDYDKKYELKTIPEKGIFEDVL